MLRAVVERFTWNEKFDFGPTKQFMDQAAAEGTLAEWVVLLPLLSGATVAQRKIGDLDGTLPILERTRRDDRDSMFSGSSPRQRMAMEIISGGVDPAAPEASEALRKANRDYPDAGRLHVPGRGAFLLTFAADTGSDLTPNELPQVVDPGDVATLFSLAFPKASAPRGRIGFTVVVQGSESAIVDRPD